jgi:hypothetical protein
MRILVTGSRDWPDAEMVADILDLSEKFYGRFTLVHGACPTGADMVSDPTCKVCGHGLLAHTLRLAKFLEPVIACNRCPDGVCQNGPDGERYREENQ